MKNEIEVISTIKTLTILASVGMLTFALSSLAIPRTANAAHCGTANCSPNSDLAFDVEDMNFILDQIKIAERHAAGEELLDILPNASIPWGLRTVDGSYNNLIPGQEGFGAADLEFGQAADRVFPEDYLFDETIPGDDNVSDSTPRLISHLITNQSVENPAAVSTSAAEGGVNIGPDIAGTDQFFIPNTAPDEGLSSPFNAFMTFFGQFFDHGLDLINKGGNGTVFMPLQQDDPLFDPGPDGDPNTLGDNGPNFMAMTRATRGAGPDTIVGTEDDTFVNATTPHVDQQQTYASHASSQILLRHYELRTAGRVTTLENTGRLLNGFGNDRMLDTADDGGMATWDTVQAQALLKFGIVLDDLDGNNVPMIASDVYGNFIPGPARGLPQLVTAIALDGTPTLVEGNNTGGRVPPVDASQALRVNQNFFLDVAHSAAPNGAPDVDTVINPRIDTLSGQVTRGVRASAPAGFYDDELLGAHFICGDGRCNENIALSTVHTIFHHEHNRLTSVAKRVLLDAGDLAKLNEWLDTPLAALPAWGDLPFPISDAALEHQDVAEAAIDALNLDWNGKRVFQAARFGTEMQYNRIVFDEFAPTLAGLKDAFVGFHTNVNPTITAEFSQSVYRFGHSMLTSTVDRFDADFNPITEQVSGDPTQLGLFEAFLNPLALYNADADGIATLTPEQGTGAVIRGITRTTANEIDEFVTGTLQNNLVGLPLDLGAINIARGRDVGNPPLNAARRMFFADTQDTRLMPYAHWADYADNLRHEATLVNFIAAYGKHPTLAGVDGIVGNADDPVANYADRRNAACAIVGALSADATAYCESNGFGTPSATPVDAMDFLFGMDGTSVGGSDWSDDAAGLTTTGLDDVDFWNGGLAEERMPFGGYLGSTHNYVFETQIESLQNGDRFYYLGRTANIHMLAELESNSFSSLVQRATDVNGGLPLNIFSVPNHVLEVDQSQQFDAAGDGTTADPTGDSELTPLVIRNADQLSTNILVLDSTRVIQYTGGDHVTISGTVGSDTIIGGIGDDSILGHGGDDRIEGGDGNDSIEAGAGDDIITDLSGFDVIEGGSGNDAISSGNGEDIVFGDAGNDFIVNSSEFGELFGGLGDDFILDGVHNGHIRGGAGNDWMENLGGGEDLFQGDNGAAPEGGEPTVIGHDVFIAHAGNNDFDMENGDDIAVDGPGIDRVEGQLGFDWVSFQNDRFGVDVDLDLTVFLRPQLPPSNNTVQNRYDRTEGISGSPFADILRGTENPVGGNEGNELINFNLVEGLVSSDGTTPCPSCIVPVSELSILANGLLGWENGELILGGGGSDLMNGKGGDDIIDGDAALQVSLLTPDPAVRSGPLGQALLAAKTEANRAASQADLDATAAAAFADLETAALAAVDAADAAVAAAQAAVAAKEAAETGLSDISVTNALGNLIDSATFNTAGTDIKTEWSNFLASCSAALADMGFEVGATDANTLAEALADQAAAVVAEADLTQAAMDATATVSAAEVAPAAANLLIAQANLDAADVMINVASMQDIMDAVFSGYINPIEISVSRVISDHDATNTGTDIAVYSGNRSDYLVGTADPATGYFEVTDIRAIALNDGRDLVRNVERLQFADQTVLVPGCAGCRPGGENSLPTGQPTIIGDGLNPTEVLTADIGTVMDADNVSSGGAVASAVAWAWKVELDPGTGDFTTLIRTGPAGDPIESMGETLVLLPEDAGLLIKVEARFQDETLAIETVTSEAVLIDGVVGPPPVVPATLSIDAATFSGGGRLIPRLRVDGTTNAFASLTLFAPGTAVTGGTNCSGTVLASTVADDLGAFRFNLVDGEVTTNPGSVCVSSDNGLAVDSPV